MCLTINRGAGGITFATCTQLAGSVMGLYSAGVSYSAAFSCSTFTATTATVCAVGLTATDAATFFTNFDNNVVAFEQLSTTYSLICMSMGATQYVDSASITTCNAAASMLVPCEQPAISFPFCVCQSTPGATPFTFATGVVPESSYGLVAGKQAKLYTFTIVIGAGFGKAAAQNVATKAEFYLHDSMRSLVLGSLVNGVFVPPSWGGSEQADTYKVSFANSANGSKGIPAAGANGIQIGILVDATTTLAALSGKYTEQLYYNIFSGGQSYCPLGFVYPPVGI